MGGTQQYLLSVVENLQTSQQSLALFNCLCQFPLPQWDDQIVITYHSVSKYETLVYKVYKVVWDESLRYIFIWDFMAPCVGVGWEICAAPGYVHFHLMNVYLYNLCGLYSICCAPGSCVVCVSVLSVIATPTLSYLPKKYLKNCHIAHRCHTHRPSCLDPLQPYAPSDLSAQPCKSI